MFLIKNFGLVIIILLVTACGSDGGGISIEPQPFGVLGCTNPSSSNYDDSATVDNGSCEPMTCEQCTYIVEATHVHDGEELGIKPGDIICLDASVDYGALKFINIRGTAENPVIIMNCGGVATIEPPPGRTFVMKTEKSEHFRIAGIGDPTEKYGIKLKNAVSLGLTLDYLSTNFEIDHLEVSDVGFAGIMAKTDPSCDNATIRGNFTMRDISIHDNFIHDTGGEGFYIGNSFYENGRNTDCGPRLPHAIEGVKVFNNLVQNSGWEAIQVGAAIRGAEVHSNIVENFGLENKPNQRNGIQIGEGSGGMCYNNVIINGNGNGLNILGYGDNVVFNNLIVNPGLNGIFCDERFTPDVLGNGYNFFNNTIINPGRDGIRLYADLVELNRFINNVVINPGSFDEYENDKTARTGEDAYIYLLNDNVNLDAENNFFSREINEALFLDSGGNNFQLQANSPLVDEGEDLTSFGINLDLLRNSRPQGAGFDIGAYERIQ